MITNPITYSVDEQKFVRIIELLALPIGELWNESSWGSKSSKRYKRFKRLKARIKTYYRNEQKFTCPYCSQVYPNNHNRAWDTDHIIPKSENATFLLEPKNLCATCPMCNLHKRDQAVTIASSKGKKTYPTKSGDFTIIHPHYDNFSDHIRITGYVYSPINNSRKGIETIRICNLSRFSTLNLPLPPDHNIMDTRAEELLLSKLNNPSEDLNFELYSDED